VTSPKQRREQAFITADRDRTGIPNDEYRMTPFIRYLDTGEIVEKGIESIAGLKYLSEKFGYRYLPISGDWVDFYVDVAKQRRRLKTPCPAVLEGLTLVNLPVPCRIEITDPTNETQTYEHDEDAVELEFAHPGEYRVRVLSVPYYPGEYIAVVP
jgi:hypothetical protein